MIQKKMKKIAPSLLSADFSDLKSEIFQVEKAGADLLHIDVMDGHFVPNLTLGPMIVEAIHRSTKLELDCHLMIENPQKYIDEFIRAGANMISFHCEAPHASSDLLKQIKTKGVKAGIAIKPDSSFSDLHSYLNEADFVLIMTVAPGFGGQKLIEGTIERVKEMALVRTKKGLSFAIEVDGGIHVDNIQELSKAGADIFVAGSSIFKSKDYKKTISTMKEKIYA